MTLGRYQAIQTQYVKNVSGGTIPTSTSGQAAASATVMAGYAAVILACTAQRSPAIPATLAIGTATGTALGVLVYALGPVVARRGDVGEPRRRAAARSRAGARQPTDEPTPLAGADRIAGGCRPRRSSRLPVC